MDTVETVSSMERAIVENIHKIRALDFGIVVHIPRSGTIPAALIATYLCRPLASVEEFCLGKVDYRKCEKLDYENKPVLLVDDSLSTGRQLGIALDRIRVERPGVEVRIFSVYASDAQRIIQPDLSLIPFKLSNWYIFTWNMWKWRLRFGDLAVDLDGILCRDPTREEDDDGPKYLSFIRTAPVRFKPIGEKRDMTIVTARLSKYREETEAWLTRNNIGFSKLVMGPWETQSEREGNHAAYKAKYYRRSAHKLFVESSPREAEHIAKVSGKPVWCPVIGKLYK